MRWKKCILITSGYSHSFIRKLFAEESVADLIFVDGSSKDASFYGIYIVHDDNNIHEIIRTNFCGC